MRGPSGWPSARRRSAAAARLRDRDLGEDLAHDPVGVDLAQRGLALDDEAVPEDGDGELLDVVGDHEVATVERGQRLPGPIQVDRAAGRRAQVHVGVLARRADQPDDVLGHGLVDVDLLDRGLHLAQLVEVEHLLELLDRVASASARRG